MLWYSLHAARQVDYRTLRTNVNVPSGTHVYVATRVSLFNKICGHLRAEGYVGGCPLGTLQQEICVVKNHHGNNGAKKKPTG